MSINYEAIADRAVELIGSADPLQYQAAYDAMTAETVTQDVTGALRMTEASILSGLGLTAGAALIDKLEAALHPSAVRLLQGEGINILDPESKAAATGLLAATAISQGEYDWIASHYTETVQVWPGIKPGHVQNALEYRQGGLV